MTIEKLEALERAKDDPACSLQDFCKRLSKYARAQQAAWPHLLAVAKAAKFFVAIEEVGGDAHDQYIELAKAVQQLEAMS